MTNSRIYQSPEQPFTRKRYMFYKNMELEKELGKIVYAVVIIKTYFSTSDGSKLRKLFAQTFVIYSIIKIFHIQIDTLVTVDSFQFDLFKLFFKLSLSFSLFLSTTTIQLLSLYFFTIQISNSLG